MNQGSDWKLVKIVGAVAVVGVAILAVTLLLRPPGAPPSDGQPNAGQPVNPGTPVVDDGQPVDLGQPVDPGQPVNPVQPVDPGQPVIPAPPANPGPPVNPSAGGVPSFVGPGTRLIWYAASASVAQSRYSWVEEPCTGQNWLNKETGKCYRRTDESGEGQPGAGGDGLSQLDIVGLDGNTVALSNTMFTIFRDGNTLIWTPLNGATVDAANVDGAWASPALLAQFEQTPPAGIMVLRGTYRLGDTAFDALSFVSGLGTSNYASYTYDLASGVLLSLNTSTGGVTSPIHAPNEDPPTGNSQLTLARFAGMRQRNIAGLTAGVPDWMRATSQMTYQGTYSTINPVSPADPGFATPAQMDVQFSGGGSNWVAFSQNTQAPGAAYQLQGSGVSGPTGPHWYDPGALAQMSQGQVLDTDPLTGEQVAVVFAGQSNSGTPVVAIQYQVPGQINTWTYDQTNGMLVALELRSINAGWTLSLQLTDRR